MQSQHSRFRTSLPLLHCDLNAIVDDAFPFARRVGDAWAPAALQTAQALHHSVEHHLLVIKPRVYPAVFAVQSAALEIFGLTELVGSSEAERLSLRDEAEQTILRFIAAIVLADGEYRDDEKVFVSLMVNWKTKAGGEARYLNEYAAKWAETSMQIPQFFRSAVDYDCSHETCIAQALLREIQPIGNNVCACDARCGPLERGVVRDYIAFLENFAECAFHIVGPR